MRIRTLAGLAAGSALTLSAAADAQYRTLNPRDVAESRQMHAELVQEMGGAETGPRAAYVESVGRKVGAFSGIANATNALHYTTLNSAVDNAFAIPGGYVYVTRQLLTIMDDEAQLAFALGHETGHIAANHAQARKSAATRNSVLGVLGAILGGMIGGGGVGNVIAQGAQQYAQLATLGFSREQEYQADTLGLRYITQAGYDPMGGPDILAALQRSERLDSRIQGNDSRSVPEWASTHPSDANRVQRATQQARQTGRAGQGLRNRDQFLAQIDGMTVDDDPAQGIIDGRVFTHPDLMLQFAVPPGYLMQNSASAVTIAGSGGKAQFSGGRFDGPLEQYIDRVIMQLTEGQSRIPMAPPRRTTINGLEAVYSTGRTTSGSSGAVDVSVMAYRFDRDSVYHFVMLTPAGQGIGPFTPMVDSFRRINAQEAAAIRPRVIRVHTVRAGETVQSLATQMAYRDFQVDRFVALNNVAAGRPLTPGQKVKLVVYGTRRR